ncbi:MAG TPA: class I adenylate-forming enzyme family protein [Syntrophomonas sp.]|nr:class I adenylate-forming enzyme family protein [Syntrophomonas sp.]
MDYWGYKEPDKEAIIDKKRRITYRELRLETNKLASAMLRIGVQKGDVVVSFVPNGHEFIEIFFAAAKLGAIMIPLDPQLEKNEVWVRLKKAMPKLIFVTNENHLHWINEEGAAAKAITVRFKAFGVPSYADILESGSEANIESVKVDPAKDVCMVMFTSGSSGVPKGVELTYKNLFQSAKNIGSRLACTAADVFIVPIPVCHLFAVVTGMIVPCWFGGKIVLIDRFEPDKVLHLIEHEKGTVLYGVPTMYVRELQEYRQKQKDLTSLRVSFLAGAYCDPNLVKQIGNELNCGVMIAYGSTETVAVLMTGLEDDEVMVAETVGRPLKGIQIKIVDDRGHEVGTGEIGELVVKGYNVMKGYYLDPVLTQETLSDGWVHMGDLVTVDEKGYVRIVGRKSDMIIRGGENIYPIDIEKIYYTHPDVLEIAVIGLPHSELGEQTAAFIVLKPNSPKHSAESLREFAQGKIAKFKIPDQVYLIDTMPKLANGKIDRGALKGAWMKRIDSQERQEQGA